MHHDEHHEESKKRKKPTVSPHRRIGETFYSPGASSHSSSACTRRSICKPKKKLEGLDPLNLSNSLDSWRVRFPQTNTKFEAALWGFFRFTDVSCRMRFGSFLMLWKIPPLGLSDFKPLKPKNHPKSPSSNHQLWRCINDT